MSYRSKTPTVISILQRKLKPGKSFEDFQKAHVPGENAKKNEFGYEVYFFGVPTRVINSVSAQDPDVIYSIGLSYGRVSDILSEAQKGAENDRESGKRVDKLDEICEHMATPIVAFVASDNDYGGKSTDDCDQTPLAKVTPEVIQTIEKMMRKKPK